MHPKSSRFCTNPDASWHVRSGLDGAAPWRRTPLRFVKPTVPQFAWVVLAVSLGALACSGDRSVTTPVPEVSRAEVLEAMTPEAAAAIGSDGKLQLATPPNTGRAQISGAQAGALAVPLARYYLPYSRAVFDAQRGSPIAYQKLVVCAQPLYVESAFERLAIDEPSQAAHPLQKGLGPAWLVKLCPPGGAPQMNVVVSAYSTDLSIDPDGDINFPPIGGNNFFPEGIPINEASNGLPTAEAAVVLAAALTRRRIAGVPKLIAPFFRDDNPLGARWSLILDRPARLRTAEGRIVETSEVYISRVRDTRKPGSRTWAAESPQPTDVEVIFVPQGRVGEHMNDYLARQKAETHVMRAVRRADVPISFIAAGADQ